MPLLLFCFLSNAQINFENGYFIGDNDKKTICLIKNVDWKNNPTDFDYRLSETSEIQTVSIENIKEFGIDGDSKFVRQHVKINTASDELSKLEGDRTITFKEQTLFLRTLVEGGAALYYYEQGDLRRFFYSIDNIEVEQLVYKRFCYSSDKVAAEQSLNKLSKNSAATIGTNMTYKQQLWNTMKCDAISRRYVNSIGYKKEALVSFFEKYNRCVDPEWVKEKREGNKLGFNLSIRPGINVSSLQLQTRVLTFPPDVRETEFKSEISFRLGLELEKVLPFNKNKWALLIEPVYRNYRNEGQITSSTGVQFATVPEVDYESLEFAIGVRHYFFLNDDSKLFISAYLLNDMELESKVTIPNNFLDSNLIINPLSNFGAGLGSKYKDITSLEFRYDLERDILRYDNWLSNYYNFSLILGYTFL